MEPNNVRDLRQETETLTYAYADREAAWLNRYNQNNKALEWAYKEAFYKKRFSELLKLLPDDQVARLHQVISAKIEQAPGESTRQRSPEETLSLIRRIHE